MELVNDLVRIISQYTIPNITLELLTISPDLATTAYNDGTWINKSLVESRGLIATGITPGNWYPYYLTVNNTHYGKLMKYTPGSYPVQVFPRHIQYVSSVATGNGYAIIQSPDKKIHIMTLDGKPYKELPFDERIRKIKVVCKSDGREKPGCPYLIFITERGNLYTMTYDSINKIPVTERAVNVVDVMSHYFERTYYMLTRTGTVIKVDEHFSSFGNVETRGPAIRILFSKYILLQDCILRDMYEEYSSGLLSPHISTNFTIRPGSIWRDPLGLFTNATRVICYHDAEILRTNHSFYYYQNGKLILGPHTGNVQSICPTYDEYTLIYGINA